MTRFYSPDDPYAGQNSAPYTEPTPPEASQNGMQWDVRPVVVESRVPLSLIEESPLYNEPFVYKNLGKAALINDAHKWYGQGWGLNK